MPDMTAITSLLTSATSAIEIAKFIKNSDISLEKSEQKLKLADLIEKLAEVKMNSADIKQALLEKDQEILELRRILQIEEELAYQAPYYWRLINDEKDGPYCQQCYDSKKSLIRLQEGHEGSWHCKSCNSWFYEANYKPATIRRVRRSPSIWER